MILTSMSVYYYRYNPKNLANTIPKYSSSKLKSSWLELLTSTTALILYPLLENTGNNRVASTDSGSSFA